MTPDREIHEDIKQRLKSVGSSFSKVARELGVTHTTVTTVSMGYRTSAKVQNGIARALGVSPDELWPDRYRGPIKGERTMNH